MSPIPSKWKESWSQAKDTIIGLYSNVLSLPRLSSIYASK